MPAVRLIIAAAAASTLTACAHAEKPPVISYDDAAFKPALRQVDIAATDASQPIEVVDLPKLLPLPGQLKPMPRLTKASAVEAPDPRRRVASANAAARDPAQPRWLPQRRAGLSVLGRRALSSLRLAG